MQAANRFESAGVAGAALDARLLAGHVAGAGPEIAITDPDRRLSGNEAQRLEALVRRRERREPLSHLLGRREFWSLEFRVTADTLDPRPDSETLIEVVLATIEARTAPLRIVDFGTGTGCLLLALLSELPAASGIGIDISEAALEVARGNAAALGLSDRASFRHGDWGKGLAGPFDIIISNPPYVRRGDIAGLQPEVRHHDPHLALDGGGDGLKFYRMLAAEGRPHLKPSGKLVAEFGDRQELLVGEIFRQAGWPSVEIAHDLSRRPRIVIASPT